MLGQFLVSPRFREVTEQDQADRCPEYWSMVQAILESAMIYRLVLQDDEGKRSAKGSRSRKSEDVVVSAEARPDTNTVDDVTRQLNQRFGRCPECGDILVVASSSRYSQGKKRIRFSMQCRGCGQTFQREADASELRDLFADTDEPRPSPKRRRS